MVTFASDDALGRAYAQYDMIVRRLHRNWNLQLLFVVVALAYLIQPDIANAAADIVKLPAVLVYIVVPVYLPYLFVNFGYLLGGFIQMRGAIESRLQSGAAAEDRTAALSLCDGQFVFDLLHRLGDAETAWVDFVPRLVFVALSTSVVGLNHAITVHYILRMDSLPSWARITLVIFLVTLLLACYCEFVRSLEGKNSFRGFALLCLMWSVAAFFCLPYLA